jgi:hypothetical protein
VETCAESLQAETGRAHALRGAAPPRSGSNNWMSVHLGLRNPLIQGAFSEF